MKKFSSFKLKLSKFHANRQWYWISKIKWEVSKKSIKTFLTILFLICRTNLWKFKYNKKKYYWYLNGYLYFPNMDWDAVRLEGVFEGDVSNYNCDPSDDCQYVQDKAMHIPEYMFAEIESLLSKDMGLFLQIPQDPGSDNKHIERA